MYLFIKICRIQNVRNGNQTIFRGWWKGKPVTVLFMLFTFPWCFILTCNTHITVLVNVITIFPLASPGYKITVRCACACHWPQAEIVKSALVRVCVHECVHVCAHVCVWLPPNSYHGSLCELIDRFLSYSRVLKWPSHCASYNPC